MASPDINNNDKVMVNVDDDEDDNDGRGGNVVLRRSLINLNSYGDKKPIT